MILVSFVHFVGPFQELRRQRVCYARSQRYGWTRSISNTRLSEFTDLWLGVMFWGAKVGRPCSFCCFGNKGFATKYSACRAAQGSRFYSYDP